MDATRGSTSLKGGFASRMGMSGGQVVGVLSPALRLGSTLGTRLVLLAIFTHLISRDGSEHM